MHNDNHDVIIKHVVMGYIKHAYMADTYWIELMSEP